MQKLTRSLLMAGAVFGLAACGDDVSIAGPAPATITGVTVSPAAITIGIGETVIMTASVSVSAGSGTPATTVAWSSANAAIATVNATTGAVTGVAVGTTTIRAAATGDPSKIGASAVTVRAAQVQSVTVTPQALSLSVGQTATAVATVNRDAGVSGAVTWSTSNAAVATVVAGTGVITAVSAGTAVITATSTADPTKAAALAVTVSAQANLLTGLTVAPVTASLGVGGTVQIVPNATTVGNPTVTYTYLSSNIAVATVSATGLVTAVGNGTAVITTTATTSTNSLSASTTITVASASVSISSITQLNLPVNLASVMGQFEVTLNISAGNQTLDSVRVTLDGIPAATQTFAGAPNAPVTLSINSAAYTVNADSTATVRFMNGETIVQAELFTSGSGRSASNQVTITLTNIDTFHARWTLPSRTATDANGLIWYGGPGTSTTVNVIPLMYSGNVVTSATINLDDATTDGNTSLCGAPIVDAASPFVATFTCANVSNANVQPAVLSSLRADGNAGPGFVVSQDPAGGLTPTLFANASAIMPVRIDVAAPTGVSLSLPASPDNWFNSSYNFTALVNRGADPMDGVGLAAASTDVYSYIAFGSTALVPFVPGPNNIPEHPTNFTNSAYTAQVVVVDRLGNASTATTGTFTFGIDNTAPTIEYTGGLTGAAASPNVVSTVRDSVLHNVVVNNQGLTSATPALFGVRIRDTRSGFNLTLDNYLYRKITRLAPSGTVCAEGQATASNLCDFVTNLLPPIGTDDPTYRRDSLPVYGITGLLTATTPGYYTYYTYANDRAGNVSGTVTKQAAIDIQAPLVTGINFPASLPGASSVAFVPNGSDDLEVISGGLYLYYPNMRNAALVSAPLYYSSFSDFDSPWNATLATPVGNLAPFGNAGFTVPHGFLNGIDEVGPGNIPPATVSGTYAPSGVGADLYDIKRGVTSLAYNSPDASPIFIAPILPQQVTPGTPFSAIGVGEWFIFATPPGSVIQARAKTLTSITNPPFPQVAFFRYTPAGPNQIARWNYLGTVVSNPGINPTIFDQGADRFWTYSLAGITPALVAGQEIRAVGMSAAGNGLSTGNFIP